MKKEILTQNEHSWDTIADDFFGVTALPKPECSVATEDELYLFPDLNFCKIKNCD